MALVVTGQRLARLFHKVKLALRPVAHHERTLRAFLRNHADVRLVLRLQLGLGGQSLEVLSRMEI